MKNQPTCGIKWASILLLFFMILRPSPGRAETDGPVASVKVMPIQKGEIVKTIAVYGTVIPSPGAVDIISVPYECQIRKILVSPGEQISSDMPLLEITPSPETRLQVEKAKAAYQISKAMLDEVKKRRQLKIATNDDVFQAQQAFTEADLQLKNYQRIGATGPRTLNPEHGGIIGDIYVQEGAVLPPGEALMAIITGGKLEARLGGEAEDRDLFQAGQKVSLSAVNRPAVSASAGIIRTISRAINPNTRLIDIFVTPADSAQLLLHEYVKGEIAVTSAKGLTVPRSAVLKSGDAFSLFTVKNGRAVEHRVKMGLKNKATAQVISETLRPGDPVVILGNYELKDGMAVKSEESK